jgi:hypothetical protein
MYSTASPGKRKAGSALGNHCGWGRGTAHHQLRARPHNRMRSHPTHDNAQARTFRTSTFSWLIFSGRVMIMR